MMKSVLTLVSGREDRVLRRIRISEIVRNPNQPRRYFDPEAIATLAESIRQYGVLNPLTVRRTANGGYELVAGERRLRAARVAGLTDVPCLLINADGEDSSVIALVENLQRRDLDFFEEANGFKRLIEQFGLTQEEAARKVGKTQSAVANKLRLLRLSQQNMELIRCNNLTERHARALLRLNDEADRINVTNYIIEHELNVSRTDTTGWAACVRIYEAELYATAKPTEPVVDKTILNQLIEQASARVEDDYTTTSWAAFATALAEAQSISAAEDANQVTVNHAADALQDAMESLVKRADNSNLVAAINSIKELDESRYQPDSWAALAQALAEAEKVAANRDATADEIEAAYTKLEAAYKALALRADMTAIDDMISKVEAMDANAHTAKSWKLVADALEAAKTVAANENATQEAVDAAARTLQAAAAALVKAGDATELNALVEETKQLDLSKYTVESADAIRQAISDAEAAIAGRASAEDLKAALDAVRNAVNTAQTKPAAPVQKPADTVKPVQKPADTVKDEHPDIAGGIANGTWGAAPTAKPNDGSAAASGSGATSAIPQTSDNFPYEVLSILACLAVGGFIVALYLKKRSGNR